MIVKMAFASAGNRPLADQPEVLPATGVIRKSVKKEMSGYQTSGKAMLV
jgi:hypothetical protein